MSKPFENLRDWITDCLRSVCGRVSPDRRAAVIVAMLIIFAALNIWITARAIWSIGRGDNPRQQIEIPAMGTPPFVPQSEIENRLEQSLNPENHDNTNIEQDQGKR